MKILQNSLRKAQNNLDKATQTKEQLDEKYATAQQKLTNCIGPLGLQNLIKKRRRHGVLMPFRVSIKRNSRLALVTWENPAYVPREERSVDGQRPTSREAEYDEWGYEIEPTIPPEEEEMFQVGGI